MKIVQLPASGSDKKDLLETIDALRVSAEKGEIITFCAVGIEADDSTRMWLGSVPKAKSRLQLLGAIENLKLHFWNDDIK